MAPRLSLLRGVETLTGISALAPADPNDPHGALSAYSLLESAMGSADAQTSFNFISWPFKMYRSSSNTRAS